MNIEPTDFPIQPAGLHVSDGPEAFTALKRPGIAASIWQRTAPTSFEHWIDQLDPTVLPKGRVILHPNDVTKAVEHLCDLSGLPLGPERTWLETDIAVLAEMFVELMSAKYLRLRLDVVTTNACRRFHTDVVSARLVCTYRGTGTQYTSSADAHDHDGVFTVSTGDPILLRGTLWPEQPASGLLHRSPPIEGSGETRLVLVLDPVVDPDDEIDTLASFEPGKTRQ